MGIDEFGPLARRVIRRFIKEHSQDEAPITMSLEEWVAALTIYVQGVAEFPEDWKQDEVPSVFDGLFRKRP
jgi:hypothetical protein